MNGLTLDAGALIAFERQRREVVMNLKRVRRAGLPIFVPAGVLGQVWRDPQRQARLAGLLKSRNLHVVPLDEHVARAAGLLCRRAGTKDVIDASVVLCALRRDTPVVTSDPDDVRRLDESVQVILA